MPRLRTLMSYQLRLRLDFQRAPFIPRFNLLPYLRSPT